MIEKELHKLVFNAVEKCGVDMPTLAEAINIRREYVYTLRKKGVLTLYHAQIILAALNYKINVSVEPMEVTSEQAPSIA